MDYSRAGGDEQLTRCVHYIINVYTYICAKSLSNNIARHNITRGITHEHVSTTYGTKQSCDLNIIAHNVVYMYITHEYVLSELQMLAGD